MALQALPRLSVADAVSRVGGLSNVLATHGFCVLHDLDESALRDLSTCDEQGRMLLSSSASTLMHVQCSTIRTRRRAACESLPLTGLGVNTVCTGGHVQRRQLHVLADAAALDLVPWPSGRQPGLRPAVEGATTALHSLARRLLTQLDGGTVLEAARAQQAAAHGDPSVLDVLMYPNQRADVVNMRGHTDPGLLTLTLGSQIPGLEVHDRASRRWVDVESMCTPAECVVLCGEALQVFSGGLYEAAPHRVRHAAGGARLSTVFELRLHAVPPRVHPRAQSRQCGREQCGREDGPDAVAQGAPPFGAEQAVEMAVKAAAEEGVVEGVEEGMEEGAEEGVEEEEQRAAHAYCVAFVDDRLARGSSPPAVLREFHVDDQAWPNNAESLSSYDLADIIMAWVATCRERAAVQAAFERATYVEVSPAFADCTGRYVDVEFKP